jgi:hypothetical protein
MSTGVICAQENLRLHLEASSMNRVRFLVLTTPLDGSQRRKHLARLGKGGIKVALVAELPSKD